MKIKLILNDGEVAEVQQLCRADFQSPTQWISKIISQHLQALRKPAPLAVQYEGFPGISKPLETSPQAFLPPAGWPPVK